MKDGHPVPSKSVVLTFDDGYLDNWVFAYPLLKKYGFQATIFLSLDFVDPESRPRPNLEDVWRGEVEDSELEAMGYLSWAEMNRMETDGVMDVQSHAMSHTWHFCADEIVDFHRPDDNYFWLEWNVRPHMKYKWMTSYSPESVPYGYPVYRFDKSLCARKYFPDERVSGILVDHVSSNGGVPFFNRPDWKQQLLVLADEYKKRHSANGRLETEAEYLSRVREELAESKRLIEKNLAKKVDFLCWPGGGQNNTLHDIAWEQGYLASTVRGEKNCIYKTNCQHIDRTGLGFSFESPTMNYIANTDLYISSQLNRYRGDQLLGLLNKILYLPHRIWLLRHGGRRSLF